MQHNGLVEQLLIVNKELNSGYSGPFVKQYPELMELKLIAGYSLPHSAVILRGGVNFYYPPPHKHGL